MRTSQNAEHLQAPFGLFSAKFKTTANEICQEKINDKYINKYINE